MEIHIPPFKLKQVPYVQQAVGVKESGPVEDPALRGREDPALICPEKNG
jgi:hypothetical protein